MATLIKNVIPRLTKSPIKFNGGLDRWLDDHDNERILLPCSRYIDTSNHTHSIHHYWYNLKCSSLDKHTWQTGLEAIAYVPQYLLNRMNVKWGLLKAATGIRTTCKHNTPDYQHRIAFLGGNIVCDFLKITEKNKIIWRVCLWWKISRQHFVIFFFRLETRQSHTKRLSIHRFSKCKVFRLHCFNAWT